MGDRCFLEINMLPCHAKLAGKIMGHGEEWWDNYTIFLIDDELKIVEFLVEEANWGWHDELTNLAAAGIPFYGWHNHGDNYSGECFAACNGHLNSVVTGFEEEIVLQAIFGEDPEDVTVKPITLDAVKQYRIRLKTAEVFTERVTSVFNELKTKEKEHMGQYHIIVNKTKKEFLHPHMFNEGMKLMEFAGGGYGIMAGLAILLAEDNGKGSGDLRSDNPIISSWAGDEITIAGDYGEPDYEDGKNLFEMAHGKYKNIGLKVIDALTDNSYVMEGWLKEINSGYVLDKNVAEFIKAKAVKLKLLSSAA